MDKAQPDAPDNTATLEINGTKYVLHEYFSDENSVNDIIAQQILRDMEIEEKELN